MAKAFINMRKYCMKHIQAKLNHQHLTTTLKRQLKHKILNIWLTKHLKEVKIRADKEFATLTHNRRYYLTFFQKWLKQYNKSQKKKYLN